MIQIYLVKAILFSSSVIIVTDEVAALSIFVEFL